MISSRGIHAKVVLGLALLRNLIVKSLARLIGSYPGGKGWLRWLQRERLAPTPRSSWDIVESTSRCIGCGLCDAAARGELDLSGTFVAWARRPEDAPLAVERLDDIARLAREVAAVCPTRVSATAIATLISDNAEELERTR